MKKQAVEEILSMSIDQFGAITVTMGGLSMLVMEQSNGENVYWSRYAVSTNTGLRIHEGSYGVGEALDKVEAGKQWKLMFDYALHYFEFMRPEEPALEAEEAKEVDVDTDRRNIL